MYRPRFLPVNHGQSAIRDVPRQASCFSASCVAEENRLAFSTHKDRHVIGFVDLVRMRRCPLQTSVFGSNASSPSSAPAP